MPASFRDAVWLFPLATALHFLEEAPGFTRWASRYASPRFTFAHWARVHALGLAYALVCTALVWRFPNRTMVFLFFALCLTESVFNTVFHLAASAASRTYVPGLITALVLYPPLFWYLSRLAHREGLLEMLPGAAAFALAGVVHAFDVSNNVFFDRSPWPGRR